MQCPPWPLSILLAEEKTDKPPENQNLVRSGFLLEQASSNSEEFLSIKRFTFTNFLLKTFFVWFELKKKNKKACENEDNDKGWCLEKHRR